MRLRNRKIIKLLKEIDDIRIDDFIMSLSKVDDDILLLKQNAIKENVPIIRDETRDILTLLLKIKNPIKILEIGTAVGYSTIIMHEVCPKAQITTLEDFEKRYIEANKNLSKYDNINLINIDAGKFLKESKDNCYYDFIFLDAAKGQYINWLNDIKRLMNKNAILISDNIFKDGEILESKFCIKKRDRTIHKRMRDFLYTISNDVELDTKIFNLGDGVSISIKK